MSKLTLNRRQAMQSSLVFGAVGISIPQDDNAKEIDNSLQEDVTRDEKFVMEAGMTREEAECWKITAKAAGLFFQLPELHPSDNQEVSAAIHVLQNKLLSRPTYRKYLKAAKSEQAQEDSHGNGN